MGRLWKLFEEYSSRLPFAPTQRKMAAALQMSPTAFGKWQQPKDLPDPINLARFAELTRLPYATVLDAALHDAGYLPPPNPNEQRGTVVEVSFEAHDEDDQAEAARRDVGGQRSRGQRRRDELDGLGEGSQE